MLLHIFKFLGLRGVRVEVRFADGPIRFSSDVLHRKAAADEARTAVARLGGVETPQQTISAVPLTDEEMSVL
jgi:1-acyl-sn-glycerol-3-phosphate acyltransferase